MLDVVKESNLGYSMVQMLTNPKFKAKLLTELDQKIKNNRRKVLTIKQENRLLQQYRVLLNKNG